MDDGLERAIKGLELIRQQCEAKHNELAGKVEHQSQLCPVHGVELPIDWDRSVAHSMRTGEDTILFVECATCKRQQEAVAKNRWLVSRGVPPRLCECSIDNFHVGNPDDEKALAAARKLCRRRKGTLLLIGDAGRGKSHLAVGVMRQMQAGRMLRHDAFLMALRRTYRDDFAEDIVSACQATKLFALDDLGPGAGRADGDPALHAVLNERYDKEMPTVITSNLPLHTPKPGDPSVAVVLGDRLVDRIREDGVIIRLTGPSRRKPARDEEKRDE
jgi:DNA replication protein DnaC